MSKPWKPDRRSAQQRPSRIRREPVRLSSSPAVPADPRAAREAEARFRKRQVRGGIAGVVAIAAVLTAAVVGISVVTYSRYDPEAAAREAMFVQCYSGGANCVIDGDTIHVAGETVQIAGIAAPQIQGARCDAERTRGIDAAMRLADLLNRGKVSVGAAFRDPYGREVRKVEVDGNDVGTALIDAGAARRFDGDSQDWCE